MVLGAESLMLGMAQTFNGLVVEIDLGDFYARLAERVAVDRKTMVLGGDRNLAGAEILDRLIGAAMPELKLEGFPAQSMAEDLVTKADAEYGDLTQ